MGESRHKSSSGAQNMHNVCACTQSFFSRFPNSVHPLPNGALYGTVDFILLPTPHRREWDAWTLRFPQLERVRISKDQPLLKLKTAMLGADAECRMRIDRSRQRGGKCRQHNKYSLRTFYVRQRGQLLWECSIDGHGRCMVHYSALHSQPHSPPRPSSSDIILGYLQTSMGASTLSDICGTVFKICQSTTNDAPEEEEYDPSHPTLSDPTTALEYDPADPPYEPS